MDLGEPLPARARLLHAAARAGGAAACDVSGLANARLARRGGGGRAVRPAVDGDPLPAELDLHRGRAPAVAGGGLLRPAGRRHRRGGGGRAADRRAGATEPDPVGDRGGVIPGDLRLPRVLRGHHRHGGAAGMARSPGGASPVRGRRGAWLGGGLRRRRPPAAARPSGVVASERGRGRGLPHAVVASHPGAGRLARAGVGAGSRRGCSSARRRW